jgi:ubiquinone/menaquinone biosynthesis C-methylase UbiE
MIVTDAALRYSIWEHSDTVAALYRRRCRLEEPEMDCAAQARELLAEWARPSDMVLDVGCGSGYFFHSAVKLGLEYRGIDASPRLIAIGREELPAFGCDAAALTCARIDDLDGQADHVVCLNVLSNIDNWQRPLARLFRLARRSVVLRESVWDGPAEYRYVEDRFLNAGVSLFVHVNTYSIPELLAFGAARGFVGRHVIDSRTQGRPEDVIGYPHHWAFLSFERRHDG